MDDRKFITEKLFFNDFDTSLAHFFLNCNFCLFFESLGRREMLTGLKSL